MSTRSVIPATFGSRRAVRRRIRQLAAPPQRVSNDVAAPTPVLQRLLQRSARLRRRSAIASPHEVLATLLDGMARELRLGASLHAAVVNALQRHPHSSLVWLQQAANDGDSLPDAIRVRLAAAPAKKTWWRGRRMLAQNDGLAFALRALVAAADGGDPVHAVESAARTLRANASIIADSRAAVAHTQSSINVLTWVPLLLAGWLILRDDGVRGFFSSTPGVVCLAAGMVLNSVGRHVVRRATRSATRSDSAVPDFVDVISVHLRSGRPPALAFMHASEIAEGDIGRVSRDVVTAHHDGERFVDALSARRQAFPLAAQPMIDALIDTENDGLSPRELFERLSSEAHAQRRREAERRIRALPVRLTLPLVGCVLPAYVLLAVVPLLSGQLSSVDIDPHPLTKGTP